MGDYDPPTFDDLMQVPAEKVGTLDIGLMNLLCSFGLPGSESVDVEHDLDLLDQWAKRAAIKTEQS